jgi:hypothetical protein
MRLIGTDGTDITPEIKGVEYYLVQIAENVKDAPTSQVARNNVNVALAAIYWKWGKTAANEAMDAFRLGRLGWKKYE